MRSFTGQTWGVLFRLAAIVALLAAGTSSARAAGEPRTGPTFFAHFYDSLPMPENQPAAESLPPPEGPPAEALPPQDTRDEVQTGCELTPTDLPLVQLTTDIRARNLENGDVVAPADLPPNCAEGKFGEQRFVSFNLSSDSCRPHWCGVLQLAAFCHRPLYFEEEKLERCGVKACCCQPAASALHFYGRIFMMPAMMCYRCPCSCVPAQYGCSCY